MMTRVLVGSCGSLGIGGEANATPSVSPRAMLSFPSTSRSAGELSSAYDDIGSAIGFDAEEVDISGWFVGFALVAAFVTAGASLFWFSRLP